MKRKLIILFLTSLFALTTVGGAWRSAAWTKSAAAQVRAGQYARLLLILQRPTNGRGRRALSRSACRGRGVTNVMPPGRGALPRLARLGTAQPNAASASPLAETQREAIAELAAASRSPATGH